MDRMESKIELYPRWLRHGVCESFWVTKYRPTSGIPQKAEVFHVLAKAR
jgi:hypothetical protein